MRYEGYGPGGVAIIVEALTDNRNRTAGEIRVAFAKFGGKLGETNSVSFMFDRKGIDPLSRQGGQRRRHVRGGARGRRRRCRAATPTRHEVLCATDDFAAVRDALEAKFGAPEEARARPGGRRTPCRSDGDGRGTLLKLIEALEDNDDVQNVVGQFRGRRRRAGA